MGGRWYFDKKDTVESCHSVSVAFLRKHDYFCGFRSGSIKWTNHWGEEKGSISVTVCVDEEEQYARFWYTNTKRSTGEKTECDYRVQLDTTPCNLGGVRYWFICPLIKNGIPCGRRVGKLYFGGMYLGCRHCYNLSYESRNESRMGRPGGIGYILVLHRKMEELHHTIKRWNYRGRPTRKARQYYKLQNEAHHCPSEEELFRQLCRRR
jgi:hypothetical protein